MVLKNEPFYVKENVMEKMSSLNWQYLVYVISKVCMKIFPNWLYFQGNCYTYLFKLTLSTKKFMYVCFPIAMQPFSEILTKLPSFTFFNIPMTDILTYLGCGVQ